MRGFGLTGLALALTLCAAACSESTSEENLPPDAESDLETLNGKADTTDITPGSSHAETVLRFVNQPIADDRAGQAFVDLLDSGLHAWAARNIGQYRAGTDGHYGTRDDQRFDDLESLDAVPWVGPVALQQLYRLAEQEGFGTPPPSVCSEFIEKNPVGDFELKSFADLAAVEDSGCTIFDGDVKVFLSAFNHDFFPTHAKRLEQLNNITEVLGTMSIAADRSLLDGVSLPNLKRVSRGLFIREYDPSGTDYDGTLEVDLSGLVEAGGLSFADVSGLKLGALESTRTISITFHHSGSLNLPSLQEIEDISIRTRVWGGGFAIDAPRVTELDSFVIEAKGDLRTSVPSLQRVGELTLYGGLAEAKFEALTEITGDASMLGTRDPLVGLTALETIGGDLTVENAGFELVEGHIGPSTLTTIGGTLRIEHGARSDTSSITGYQSLNSVKEIIISVDCDNIDAFNALKSVNALDIRTRGYCSIDGFENLEFIAGDFRLAATSQPYVPMTIGLDSLVEIGGDFDFTDTRVGETLEALELIGGDFRYRSRDGFSGFNALKTVDGNLHLSGGRSGRHGTDELLGLNDLIEIGQDFVLSEGIADDQIQRVVDQLQILGGTVRRH